MTRQRAFVLVALVLLTCSCGGGENAPAPQPDPADPGIVIGDTFAGEGTPGVSILAPGSNGVAMVDTASVQLRGALTGDVTALTWENLATGATGDIPLAAQWSVNVPLQNGANTILVNAEGPLGEDGAFRLVERDPNYAEAGPLLLDPAQILVGQTKTFTATCPVDLLVPVTAVELWEVDFNQQPIGELADMLDDGQAANGDEEAGDGTYSGQFQLSPTEALSKLLRVRMHHAGGALWGPMFLLPISNPIDPTAFQDSLDFQDELMTLYEQTEGTSGREAAIAAVTAALEGSPLVHSFGRGGEEGGFGILFEAGFLGALLLSPDDRRGCGPDNCPPNLPPNGACFSALNDIPGTDEADTIYNLLDTSDCGPFQPLEYGKDNVRVIDVRIGLQKGVFVIATHGDNVYYGNGLVPQNTLFGTWAGAGGLGDALAVAQGHHPADSQPFFMTNEFENPLAVLILLEEELATGQVVVIRRGNRYQIGLTPGYITARVCCPDSIVYVGSCRSAFNGNLANAFISTGASAFIGYTSYVDSNYATARGTEIFQNLVNGQSLGEAWNRRSETGPSGAKLEMWHGGDASLDEIYLPVEQVKNPSFEIGLNRALFGWGSNGDVFIRRKVGDIRPPSPRRCNKKFLSIEMEDDSFEAQLGQSVCVPLGPERIRFKYNIVSQDFMEVCPDGVYVSFTATIGPHEIVNIRTDQQCDGLEEVNAGFDPDEDSDGKTYQTGWRTAEANISDLAARKVQLEFEVIRPSDANLPTYILIDQIEWVKP